VHLDRGRSYGRQQDLGQATTQDGIREESTMHAMNANELQFFKDLLLKQRSEILNKTDQFKAESAVENMAQGDEVDLAVSELSLSMTLHLKERETQLLQKIDRALGKIEEGSFGFCEQCDEPLHINRLKARPVANLCIACKEEQESKERIFA
jgi:DnaK suppressor protein